MRTLLAVLRRETWERRQIVLLGLFLGVLCPVVAYLPFGFPVSPVDLRNSLAIGVSVTFFGLMSFLIGLGLFAADQAAGRAGFYLSRPIRPWQLFVGRVVAAVAVVMLGTLMVALPSMEPTGKLWDRALVEPLVLAICLTVALLTAGHVAGVVLRLRGGWTLLDLGAFAVAALHIGSLFQRTREEELVGLGAALLYFLAVAVTLSVVVGVWVQLRHGGTQRGRLHAAFSLTFWILVLAGMLYCEASLRSALSKGWDDIESFREVTPSGDGSAVWLTAEAGLPRSLSYVLDLKRGAPIELGPVSWWSRDPVLEGRSAVWVDCDWEQSIRSRRKALDACRFRFLDLDSEALRPIDLGLRRTGDRIQTVVLSSDGAKLAVQHRRGMVTIYSLPEARPIGDIELPGTSSLLRIDSDGSILAMTRSDFELSLDRFALDGNVRPLACLTWPEIPGPVMVVETADGSQWLTSCEVGHAPMDVLLSGQGRRAVGGWAAWWEGTMESPLGPEFYLHAVHRDGRLMEVVHLPNPHYVGRAAHRDTYPQLFLGPHLGSGQLLVTVGEIHRRRIEIPFWARLPLLSGSRREPMFSSSIAYESEKRWTTHYVDLDLGRIVATFEGFRALPKRLQTASGPEAWLQDERGMPYRFDPKRLDPQNPISSLEPVFRPPWDDDGGSEEP